jgi:hypothetical protein
VDQTVLRASYLVYGSSQRYQGILDIGTAGTVFEGPGVVVSDAGDMNGDGFDDVAIGSYQSEVAGGSVYLFYGRSGGFPSTRGDCSWARLLDACPGSSPLQRWPHVFSIYSLSS